MLKINIALPSGKRKCFAAEQSSKVGDLKVLAQKVFRLGFLRLVTADGHPLIDPMQSLHAAGVHEGDHVTAIALQAKMTVTKAFESEAFALWCCGGDKIVTWGNEYGGGDSSEIQDQLINVQQVQSTGRAFAALLAAGSVVTWGDPDCGGDSSEVQDQLWNVQQIQAAAKAFAAILDDGSVATWGDEEFGGDSSAVQDQIRNVQQIQATTAAFAAILADESVVTWGFDGFGGDSLEVQDQLRIVKQVQATQQAFAAIKADGSVVTWGCSYFGGDSSEVQDQLRSVCQVQASNYAFAAILSDGGVVTWGDPGDGGDSSEVQDQLRNVQQIQATESAFDGLNLLHVPELIFTWQSSHGATKLGVVTALPSKINFGMCSRFKLHRRHLLQSWMTDRLLLGVLQTLVVTALQCKIGSEM